MNRDIILSRLSMRDVFARYVTEHQAKTRVPCPLHGSDKQKSMQLYDTSFYCFSCATGGDLIKFVSCFFNIPYAEAINKLASDFYIQKPSFSQWRNIRTSKPKQSDIIATTTANSFYITLCDYYKLLTRWHEQYKPIDLNSEIDDRFIIAERDLDCLGYILDEYINQPLPEELIIKWSKDIINNVRRNNHTEDGYPDSV